MTFRQPSSRPRWALPFLAALIAALAAILVGNLSAASAAVTAETRIGASGVVVEPAIGPPERIAAGQQLGNDGQRVVVVVATGVAANAGTRTGPPRDALGRFTSGAGGESAATAAGRSAHANYANTLGAVDYSQNIVRELKPATPGAISRGWRQVNEYKTYLEELTGQPWTAYVDVYTP